MTSQSHEVPLLSFWNRALSRKGPERTLAQFFSVVLALLIVVSGSIVIGATNLGIFVLIGLVAVIVFVNIFLHPSVGLYLAVLVTYLNLSWIATETLGIPSLNRPLMAFILISVIATRNIVQNKKFIFRRTEGALLAYLLVLAISSLMGDADIYHEKSINAILDIAKDLLMMIIVVQLAYDERVWKRMIWALLLSAAFVSSLTWYHFFTGDYQNDFFGLATSRLDSVGGIDAATEFLRSGGQVGEPNYYAQSLLMVLPIGLTLSLASYRPFHRFLAMLSSVIIVGAVIFTYSRSGFFVLIIISVLTLYWMRVNILRIGLIALVVAPLVVPLLPPTYLQRVGSLIGLGGSEANQTTDVSLLGRASELIVATRMFQDSPLIGIGYSLYEFKYLQYSSQLGIDSRYENRQAHSLYLEALAETGLIGLFAFGMMYWVIYRSAFAAIQTLNRIERADLVPWLKALILGLTAYLLTSINLHDDFGHYLRLSIALVLGMTALVDHLQQEYELNRRAARTTEYAENRT